MQGIPETGSTVSSGKNLKEGLEDPTPSHPSPTLPVCSKGTTPGPCNCHGQFWELGLQSGCESVRILDPKRPPYGASYPLPPNVFPRTPPLRPLSPGFPSPASLVLHSLLLLAASCVPDWCTSCLLSFLNWPLPHQTPFALLSPLLPVSPIHSLYCFLCPYLSPILPQTPSSASGLPGFTLSLHASPAPPEAKPGALASSDPPISLSLWGTGSSLPALRALSAAARPDPTWFRPVRGESSPRLLAPSPTPPAAAGPEAEAPLQGRPPLASIPCPDWPLLDNRPSQQNLRLWAPPPSPPAPISRCRRSTSRWVWPIEAVASAAFLKYPPSFSELD